MDKKPYDYLISWLALHEEWRVMLRDGADAPRRTDGQMLNGVRNRMIHMFIDMLNDGYTFEMLLEEAALNKIDLKDDEKYFPPWMEESYMKDADLIRCDANAALEAYKSSEAYKYIKENIVGLRRGADAVIIHRLENEVGFVKYLEVAIEKDFLPDMKRYSNHVDLYLGQLERAKELLMMRIEHMQPFS